MAQQTFNPSNYNFNWTDNWYEWDRKIAHKEALKARNLCVKLHKASGLTVTTFSLPNQLITRGGIGSGNPQIEMYVTVYGLNVYH